MSVVAVSTKTDFPPELPPGQDNEIQQNIEELPKENIVENMTAHELVKVKRELEDLKIQYNRIHAELAKERQECNAAMKYKPYYQAYIDLQKSTSQKDLSINWLLLAGGFLLGVILSGVVFWAI